jgi:uncharacterized protein
MKVHFCAVIGCAVMAGMVARAGPNRQDREAFVDAARRGDLELVRQMLDRAPGLLNVTNSTDETALFKAAWAGHTEIAKLLIGRGADVNAGDFDIRAANPAPGSRVVGETPLTRAISTDQKEIVELLLSKGADVTLGTEFTALEAAIAAQDKDLAQRLIQLGAKVTAHTANDGSTALHGPALVGRPEMAAFLLDLGAEVNAADNEGRTPLYLAAEKGHAEVVDLLIRRGANVDARNRLGGTPLMEAVRNGHAEVVRRLLTAGADAKAATKTGMTVLMHAVLRRTGQGDPTTEQRLAVMDLLAKAGADAAARDKFGDNALHYAVPTGSVELAKWLVAHGADVNARGDGGFTPLANCRVWGNTKDLRKYLREQGATE